MYLDSWALAERANYASTLLDLKNKKFWEDLIAYFP
jgi:hypothetical protein